MAKSDRDPRYGQMRGDDGQKSALPLSDRIVRGLGAPDRISAWLSTQAIFLGLTDMHEGRTGAVLERSI